MLPILKALFLTVIAQGVIIWLRESWGIDVPKMVASLLDQAANPTTNEAMKWVIAGVVGIVLAVLWEKLKAYKPATDVSPHSSLKELRLTLKELRNWATREKAARRDKSVLHAIYYIAHGNWEIPEQTPDTTSAITRMTNALKKVRQAALDGDLPVWAQERKSGPWVLVPASYWQYWNFDWFSFLKKDPEKLRTKFDGPGKRTYQPNYQSFMTSRTKVEELWPDQTRSQSS